MPFRTLQLIFPGVPFLFVLSGCLPDKEERVVRSAPAYSIGTVTYLVNSEVPRSCRFCEYTYMVDSEKYSNNEVWGSIRKMNGSEKYLVMYEKNKPSESVLFVKYPVSDSAQFQQYLQEFAVHPPSY